jgi:hypothetical protein
MARLMPSGSAAVDAVACSNAIDESKRVIASFGEDQHD